MEIMTMSIDKTLVLMRGVSGSGKSTRAHLLADGKDSAVVSTDDFWYDDDGNYNFDHSRIGDAHEWARNQVWAWMERKKPYIIVDNTNTRWWEMMPYLRLAREYKYDVRLEMVGSLEPAQLVHYAARNKHGVPLDVIQRQAKNFQKLMDPAAGYHLEKLRSQIEFVLENG
jgi:predicted kinase